MAKKTAVKSSGSADTCGPWCFGIGLFASILLALGLWLIVTGVLSQIEGAHWLTSALWYFGGFLLMLFGKGALKRACAVCR